jgi:putative phosphoribosyl transferase
METIRQHVMLLADGALLHGDLEVAPHDEGLVAIVDADPHGRQLARGLFVAGALEDARLGTLLLDLISEDDPRPRPAAEALARRLLAAVSWLETSPAAAARPIGFLALPDVADALLLGAVARPDSVAALVCAAPRADRIRLEALSRIRAPTLILVGTDDPEGLEHGREIFEHLRCVRRLVRVPGAGLGFAEHGALERLAEEARGWLGRHLGVPERLAASPLHHAHPARS